MLPILEFVHCFMTECAAPSCFALVFQAMIEQEGMHTSAVSVSRLSP